MKRKEISFIVLVLFLIGIFTGAVVLAEEEIIDPNVPDSWYEAPKLSSEWGIENFHQSPILDEKVKEGELLPVEERLPEDPPVIEPYNNQIGEYGGIANVWGNTLDSFWNSEAAIFQPNEHLGRATPDATRVVPHLIKNWEYSEDDTVLTFEFRKGLKWSDGEPFTADDYMYWWEHEANNEELNPTPPEKWNPPLLEVKKIDKYTLEFHFGESVPHRHLDFNKWCWWGIMTPAHYLKDFHPDFIGEEEANKKAENYDLDNWFELYGGIKGNKENPERFGGIRPTLQPYIPVERTETYVEAERNPYYPFVDTEGNQLPYIDKIRLNLAESEEMLNAKATTGEATIAARFLKTTDIPLYKKYEEQGDYNTYLYTSGRGAEIYIMPNLNHEDSDLRDIFQNVKFRKALSLGMDREDINNKIYYGNAVSRQHTIIPTSEYYKEEYSNAYIDYNPEKAEELLDEIGMVDQDGDGFRETPEGDTFKPTLLFLEAGMPAGSILELVVKKWNEIGLNVDLKMVSKELITERKYANNWDMSIWRGDRTVDTIFPAQLNVTYAPVGSDSRWSPWVRWCQWDTSAGEEGEEPPEEIKELLVEPAKTFLYSPDSEKRDEAIEKLLNALAENLWTIGTVGMAPRPVIVSEKLQNVPEKGYLFGSGHVLDSYYRSQFWLEE